MAEVTAPRLANANAAWQQWQAAWPGYLQTIIRAGDQSDTQVATYAPIRVLGDPLIVAAHAADPTQPAPDEGDALAAEFAVDAQAVMGAQSAKDAVLGALTKIVNASAAGLGPAAYTDALVAIGDAAATATGSTRADVLEGAKTA